MTKLIEFTEAEVVEPQDLEAVSAAAREGDENIVGGAIGYPLHHADFTVETPSAQTIRVNDGRLFVDKTVYDLDASVTINLLTHLPTVIGDQRYIAVLVRGISETITSERFIETDVDTGETTATQVPKTNRRTCEFVIQQGLSSPTPIKPVVADTNCCLCYVLLGVSGIVSVESSNDHRVKTLYEVEGRVTVLEGQMVIAFARTQTLQTDLANLQAQLKDFAKAAALRQVQGDMARVRRLLGFPDEARAYWYDQGLVKGGWDLGNASWLARVDEGIRFAWASESNAQLALTNPGQTGIKTTNGVVMLDWTEVTRVEVDGTGSTKNISQQEHTVTTPVQRSVSRTSISYGPTFADCGNRSEYESFDAAAAGQTYQINGETFEKVAAIDATYAGATIDVDYFNKLHNSAVNVNDLIVHNSKTAETGARTVYAARSVQVNTWSETYWDNVTETFGVNGSIYAQTFLLTQPMILTAIELAFSRVATDGDVTLILCEVSSTGQPLFDAVIARSTLTPSQMAVGWVRFPFTPRYLSPGKRYAWATVTTGNHAIRTVKGARYTQGSLFWSTDGAWAQGSTEEDFAFRLKGAEFSQTRAEILFDPLTLEGGMTEIKLIYEAWAPDGTAMMWSVRTSGEDEWKPIAAETDDNPNPLRGLPASCSLKLTMLGTNGLSPAIVMNNKARGMAMRPRGDFVAVTKPLDFGLSTTEVMIDMAVDAWDDDLHSVTPKLKVGATTYTASSVSETKDVQKATRRLVKASFTVPSTTTAQPRIDMATTSVQSVPFIENITVYAL